MKKAIFKLIDIYWNINFYVFDYEKRKQYYKKKINKNDLNYLIF